MGRKDSKKNPDGFFRAINELKMLKEAGKAGIEENSLSLTSGHSRVSGNSCSKSARSRNKRRKSTNSEKGGRHEQPERN